MSGLLAAVSLAAAPIAPWTAPGAVPRRSGRRSAVDTDRSAE
ncbi:hypothetical protein ACIP68_26355 [Streptomyces griseoviridis]